MHSLLIAVAFLVILGIWGVLETGRKFRKEFQARGESWSSVCTAISNGQGVLVVDAIWGPQRGLGHPVIWWLPRAPAPDESLADLLQDQASPARLVRCPRRLRSEQALKSQFGDASVLLHSWAINTESLASSNDRA